MCRPGVRPFFECEAPAGRGRGAERVDQAVEGWLFPCAAELGDTVVREEGLKEWGETMRPFAWFDLGGKVAGGWGLGWGIGE